MNRRIRAAAIFAFAATVPLVASPPPAVAAHDPGIDKATGWVIHQSPATKPSKAYVWMHIMQEASGRSVDRVGARPTIISREMHIVITAMFDAWAAYDAKAVGTRLGGTLRRPAAERTLANKEKAVGQAAYRALLAVYPEDADWIAEQAKAQGLDPADRSTDPATPVGVGNLAAQAVIDYRMHDGANQLGDEAGSNGKPYSDYTFYECRNTVDTIHDPDRWQPITFTDAAGKTWAPGFLTAQWYRVKPFALTKSDQFRPGPPPKVGSEQLKKEVDECIASNGHLSHEDKSIVEFMRDGPRSTGQSGHWLRFAADVSRRDRYGIDQDVKLFFAVTNVVFDAFISCWETKRYYDSSRPWTLVRHYYKGQNVVGYLGPCKGFGTIPAEKWHPYSPASFVTPPFPGYTSGHATASAAAATILELFTGSDRFEAVGVRSCGELTETDCTVAEMMARDGVPAKDAPHDRTVRLKLPTFSATAAMAARSRMLGGYHIATDNNVGLEVGEKVARYSWPIYQSYFDGTATVRDPATTGLAKASP